MRRPGVMGAVHLSEVKGGGRGDRNREAGTGCLTAWHAALACCGRNVLCNVCEHPFSWGPAAWAD